MQKDNDKRAIIVEVATRVFSRYGYAKTSMDEIAHEAGIAKATIYYYFANKEDLFMAAIDTKAEDFFAQLTDKILSASSFAEQLKEYISLPIRYMYIHMPILLESLETVPRNYLSRMDEFRLQCHSRMLGILREIMDTAKRDGVLSDVIPTARLCEVIGEWFLLANTRFAARDFKEVLERIERDHELLVNLILHGMLKKGDNQ